MTRTIDDVLAEARSRLDRLSPRDAWGALAEGALLVDIRPAAQRADGGRGATGGRDRAQRARVAPRPDERPPHPRRHRATTSRSSSSAPRDTPRVSPRPPSRTSGCTARRTSSAGSTPGRGRGSPSRPAGSSSGRTALRESEGSVRDDPAVTTSEPTLTRAVAPSRVPEVAAVFWVTKALTTAMGESASDFLVRAMVPQIAVLLGAVAFTIALTIQLRAGRYVVVALLVRRRDGRRLRHHGRRRRARRARRPVHGVDVHVRGRPRGGVRPLARQREDAVDPQHPHAVDASCSTGRPSWPPSRWAPPPGTCSPSPSTSATWRPVSCSARSCWSRRSGTDGSGMNAVLAFWAAYVLTRPVGASFADWFGQPEVRGGLGLGSGRVAAGAEPGDRRPGASG